MATANATTAIVWVFLLSCLAVCSHGYSGLDFLNGSPCPADAPTRLDSCLTTLERITQLGLLPGSCRVAMDALQCSKRLVRSCMGSKEILKVLSSHDLSLVFKLKPIALCQGQ